MGRRVSITRGARDARVEIIQPADESTDAEPVPVDLYVPPIRKPPIVIALQPLERMLNEGSFEAHVGDATHVGVIVDPGEAISANMLARAAATANADIVVGLQDELGD